jgi:protease PrsW
MSTAVLARRWAWVAVLAGGTALYLVLLELLVDSRDPSYVPAMVLTAGSVVPATFMTLAAARKGRWRVRASVLATAAFLGGVIGTVAAARLGFRSLLQLSAVPIAAVALVEEAAKLVVPAAATGLRGPRRQAAEGLVIGASIGMGFAALETMTWTFTTLLDAQGDVGAVEQLLFPRGLLSPAANAAWTGLACGALWRLVHDPRAMTAARFVATFAVVVALHALWDGLHSQVGYASIGAVSVGWLAWQAWQAYQGGRA